MTKSWIQKSTSPAEFSILFIKKQDSSLRLCVDYHELNRIMIKNHYSLSLIDKILDRVSESKCFTKLDLCDAYHHICIKKSDE